MIFINKLIFFIVIFTIIFSVIFIPFFYYLNYDDIVYSDESVFIDLSSEYIWPIPGYTRISSNFGRRTAPTQGAATFHTGIDIPAPEGTRFFAVCDGKIIFVGFLGGGGYTITLQPSTESKDIRFTYCHVSPNYIVSEGDMVNKGDLIGFVGPKYVYGVPGNIYSDENGKPTNGATTGCHLHFGFRINDEYYNPLDLFSKSEL